MMNNDSFKNMEDFTEQDRKMVDYAVNLGHLESYDDEDIQQMGCALALLAFDPKQRAAKACDLLRQYAGQQNREPKSPGYGTGFNRHDPVPAYDTAEYPKESLFNGHSVTSLGLIFRRYWHLVDDKTKVELLETCKAGLFEFLQRDLRLMGSNQTLEMTTGLLVYGAILDLKAIVKKGLYRLQHFLHIAAYNHAHDEYNSTTYSHPSIITLAAAGLALAPTRPDISVLCRLGAEWIALTGALHYHAPTAELGGPYYRSYIFRLRGYAGGFTSIAYKLTGDERHLYPKAGRWDHLAQVATASCGNPWSRTIRSLMTSKQYPYQVRSVSGWQYAHLPLNVNLTIEERDIYINHNTHSARIHTAGKVCFDEATPAPGRVATNYQTKTFTLGSFSTGHYSYTTYTSPFHRTSLIFHYTPGPGQGERDGIIAGTNTDERGPENKVISRFCHRQDGRVILGVYEIEPLHTHSAQMFMALTSGVATEKFYNRNTELKPDTVLEKGEPAFMEDGDFYVALIPSADIALSYRIRQFRDRRVSLLAHVAYEGEPRSFSTEEKTYGAFAFICGDRATDKSFDAFRQKVLKAALHVNQSGLSGHLSLRNFEKRMDVIFPSDPTLTGRLFVDGVEPQLDSIIGDCCHHAKMGQPFKLGEWWFDSQGNPICVALAPDGLSWILYQPISRKIRFEASGQNGGLRIDDMSQGRLELRLDTKSPALFFDTVEPSSKIESWGNLKTLRIENGNGISPRI